MDFARILRAAEHQQRCCRPQAYDKPQPRNSLPRQLCIICASHGAGGSRPPDTCRPPRPAPRAARAFYSTSSGLPLHVVRPQEAN